MSVEVQTVVLSTVGGLGYELVDIERTSRGLLRIYIDKEGGISVEDCANVSNHLSRVFLVENIDFDRLEVSSPGLDRPLKGIKDFERFVGHEARVRLNAMIENRKRFDGVIEAAGGGSVTFRLIDDKADAANARTAKPKSAAKLPVKGKVVANAIEPKLIQVPVENIDRARLIPEI